MVDMTNPGVRAAHAHLIERKDAGDPIEVLTKQFGRHADATFERINATEEKLEAMNESFLTLQKRAAGGHGTAAPSWGEQFVKAKGLAEFAADASRPGRFRQEIKEVTTLAGSGGSMAGPFRDPRVSLMSRATPTVRSLLPVVQMSGNVAQYIVQTARATNAATVAEGALKPESNVALEERQAPAQVIAHWIVASKQVLDDSPQLRDLIDTDLLYGLDEEEDNQLLNGDGQSPNLDGLIRNSTAFVDTLGITSPTLIDTIAAAILQNASANFPADGIVLHPSDWMQMRTLKDADGRYILGAPQDTVAPRLFGLPVVESQALAAGKFLVGNFKRAATLYDRWQPQVVVSSEDRDNFVRNRLTILAEKRIALAIKQPLALTYGSFPAA